MPRAVALLMIRFVAVDFEGAVDLFQQDHPHHLMGEGHSAEGQLEIRPSQKLLGKPQRTADDEDHIAGTLNAQLIDLLRQLLRR